MCRPSDREARAAAAGGLGVGVFDLEGLSDQVVDEVDFRSLDIGLRYRIDQHHRAIALDGQIVLIAVRGQRKFVLKARATATIDGDPQGSLGRIGLQDFLDPVGGPAC